MFILKTLIRDTLVDNAAIKTLFNAAATGSCIVRMSELMLSAVYPNISIDYVGGATVPGMDGENGRLYLRVESASGSGAGGNEHAIKDLGRFRSAILNLLDDTNLSATATLYWIHKTNETGERWDQENNCYYNVLGFDCLTKQNFSYP